MGVQVTQAGHAPIARELSLLSATCHGEGPPSSQDSRHRGLTGCVAEGQSTGQPWHRGSAWALNPQPHRRYCKPTAHKEPDVACGPRAMLANMPRVLATEGYSGSVLCLVQQATLQSSRPLKTQQSDPSAGPEWRQTSDNWTKPSVYHEALNVCGAEARSVHLPRGWTPGVLHTGLRQPPGSVALCPSVPLTAPHRHQ